MKFRVTVKFDRKNSVTGELETNVERWGEHYAADKEAAKKLFLTQFRENEPNRRRIHKVTVKELE